MNVILIAVIVLGGIGLVSAMVLFVASKKFAVHEDPRIAQVAEVLPQANCGGCGYPGCSGFANACVKAADGGSLGDLNCAPGGKAVMEQVAGILGLQASESAPKVAVVRCNGTCEARPRAVEYNGARSCRIQQMTGMGETMCGYGCLGGGDCVEACKFDAIHIDSETGLPAVDQDKCTACGACAKACPRNIIELRNKNKLDRRVYVSCVNKDKGPVAKKACAAACIGCGKCVKACPFEAITLEGNVAYIDHEKCRLCRKCVDECPQGSILAVNFPPKKVVAPAAEKPAQEPSAAKDTTVNTPNA